MLPTGQLIAIKRCRQGSVQGGPEFNAEIEVLSRVHHKNVVNLVGFCFERGEQILIYEFARNGSLRDSLSGMTQRDASNGDIPLIGAFICSVAVVSLHNYISSSHVLRFERSLAGLDAEA